MAPTVSGSRLCYQLISFIFPFSKYSSVTSSDMLGIRTNMCDSLCITSVTIFASSLPDSCPRATIRLLMPCLSAWASSDIDLRRSIFYFSIFFSPTHFSLSDIAGYILLHLNFFDTTIPTDRRRSEFCQKVILVFFFFFFQIFSFVCIGLLIGLIGV